MAVDTMFQPQSGSGSGTSSGSYVQDNFLDTSNKATNNSGLSSTALKNPLSFNLNDNDVVQYAAKTLFIKNLVLIEDRSQWVNQKPTYNIVWTEDNEAVKGYVVGDCRLRALPQGNCVEINETADLIGVTGVIRQIAWLVNSTSQTGTALRYTDAVTGTNITFGSSSTAIESFGVNSFAPRLHNSTLEDANIHDFRIAANQQGVLKISGVVVYTQNATSNINVNPGNTYVNKTLVTSSTATALALPTIVSKIGAITGIKKATDATVSLVTNEAPYINTSATGFINTNLVNAATGQGASFPLGTAVAAVVGTSFYVGFVTNQSTDTLTVSPTLPFGLSNNNLYKVWSGIPTLAISSTLYSLKSSLDFSTQNNFVDAQGFNVGGSGLFGYSDPTRSYRMWGRNLNYSSADGVAGIQFAGATAGNFLQVDGNFSAAEFEYHGQGIMNATLCVNGLANWSMNDGVTGSFRRTVFTNAGPGWNSINMEPGSSFGNVVLTKINLYEMASGVTVGPLATFETHMDTLTRLTGPNATMMVLGGNQRVYADSLYLSGAWTRGTSYIFPGNVAYFGATTNCNLLFDYYGTNFAFVGATVGTAAATIDGSSISFNFNQWNSVPTLAWHQVSLTYTSGATIILSAVDYLRPTTGQIRSKQNYTPLASLKNIPQVFTSQYTPQNSKDSDFWVQKKTNSVNSLPTVWVKLFGMWCQLSINTISDDPNVTTFVRSHGSSTGAAAGGQQDVELFNTISWTTGTASTLGARINTSAADCSFNLFHTIVDGITTGSAVGALTNYFNKVAWSAFTARGTPRVFCGSALFYGSLYVNRGSTTTADSGGTAVADKWNGSAWSTGTVWAAARGHSGYFVIASAGLMSALGGNDTGGTTSTTHETRTIADVLSTATAVPASSSTECSSAVTGSLGLLSNVAGPDITSTAAYTWNGAAWSAALVTTYVQESNQGNGQAAILYKAYKNGGNSGNGATPVATSESYNSVAFAALTASSTSRGRASSSAI